MTKIAVFASGHGSNLQALIDAIDQGRLDASIELVVCDRNDAFATERATAAGITTFVFTAKEYASKRHYEEIISQKLLDFRVEYLVLAGYMRLIGPTILHRYPNRIINIHPSLLPLFPGKDAIGQALQANVRETGVTVHYVDAGMDTGPIIAQERIQVAPGQSRGELEQSIHAVEHALYPQVLQQIFKSKGETICPDEL